MGSVEKDRKPNAKKKPKKVSAAYLERAALHYLGRFSSSKANLKAVLVRKVRRRNEGFAAPSSEQMSWIEDVVAKCERYGYVDDERYAQQRSESMLRRGKPVRAIKMDLKRKGISEDTVAEVLTELEAEGEADINKAAAAAFVKRRRFGPFRRAIDDPEALAKKKEKELASMARAGFGFELSKQMLSLTEEEVTDLLV